MCIFAVGKIEQIRDDGKIHFCKLFKDNRCLFDDFVNSISKNKIDEKKLKSIYACMDFMAENDSTLPLKKFNSIKKGKNVIGYEFKKDDLRVYCVKKEPNVIVILGGYKKNQEQDIDKFIRLISDAQSFLDELS